MAGQAGKNRKYGRNKKRPANASYSNARKWSSNKDKAMARDAKRKQEKKDNPPKVARGTARAARRAHLQKEKA